MSKPACGMPRGYVTAQGVNSCTFVPPPLDGTLFVPEILDWHLERSPNHPFAVIADDNTQERSTVTWAEVGRAAHRLGSQFLDAIPDGPANAEGKPRTIAILANVDSLTYATIVLALLRAGFEPFALSSRNSVPALHHLLESTQSSYVVGSVPQPGMPPSALQETTQTVLAELPNVKLIKLPNYRELYPRLSKAPADPYDAALDSKTTRLLPPVRSLASYQHPAPKWPGVMLHSSGSTSFPKPIRLHHEVLCTWQSALWYGDVDACGSVWAIMTCPLFHAMGVFFGIIAPMSSGTTPIFFRPSASVKVPTAENVLATIRVARASYVLTPPSFCKPWSQDLEAMKSLAALDGLIYGGGPLPQEIGDRLVQHGVNLMTAYGSTEVGLVNKLIPSRPSKAQDWKYFEFSSDLKADLVPEDGEVYHLIVRNEGHQVAVYNVEGQEAFDTNDLIEEHPTRKGLWKVVGRADDQIMMSNGEKTNPGPLEDIIACNPAIRGAMMFGRARTQIGVAIEPAEHVKITTEADLETFKDLVWLDIEKANAFAPSHSRIFREFILVLDPVNKPVTRTPKGSLAKNTVLKQYADEIEALYNAASRPNKAAAATLPSRWEKSEIYAFVSQVVHDVMRNKADKTSILHDDRDLFEQGCDSLQATYIRTTIINALRQMPVSTEVTGPAVAKKVPQNVVFTHPTVCQLASFIVHLVSNIQAADDHALEAERHTSAMLKMADKYSRAMFRRTQTEASHSDSGGEVVLLTGSTGTLGTYLLQILLEDPRVEKVYAMNRASSGKGLRERQEQAFVDRGGDGRLLQSAKLRLVEADATKADFALNCSLLDEIRGSITAIIHNAWRLDFNLSLSSYEPHVRATRNLVDLALSSPQQEPPQFIFTSSIGTVSNWKQPIPVPEESIADPHVAAGAGYGESKWVAQQVVAAAAKEQGLRATIWRIGQLAGSTINGAWSTTDWVPIIAKAGEVLGSLPAFDSATVSWLPTDKAAQSIIDVLHKPYGASARYLNLVHPQPAKWNNVFGRIGNELGVPLCPAAEWFSQLESAARRDALEIERNPAIKLLDFLRVGVSRTQAATRLDSHETRGREAMGLANLETARARDASQTLRELPSLCDGDVDMWIGYWRDHGLFPERADPIPF